MDIVDGISIQVDTRGYFDDSLSAKCQLEILRTGPTWPKVA
jgi:hypothetical protein